jgi:hypothetical protein
VSIISKLYKLFCSLSSISIVSIKVRVIVSVAYLQESKVRKYIIYISLRLSNKTKIIIYCLYVLGQRLMPRCLTYPVEVLLLLNSVI